MRSRGAWALLLLGSAGCDWTRFDDVSSDPPVVLLDKPSKLSSGYGDSIAVSAQGDDVYALVTGRAPLSRGALFRLGVDEAPDDKAEDTSSCLSEGDERVCTLAVRSAGLGRAWAPDGRSGANAFALGLGIAGPSTGLIVRTADGLEYTLAVPEGLDVPLTPPAEVLAAGDEPAALYLATDRAEAPALLAVSAQGPTAWYYEPESRQPIPLELPATVGASIGRATAVGRLGEDRFFAIGAPDEGELWLFRVRGGSVERLGCLGGQPQVGRAVAAGAIDGDEQDELVLSDASSVRVIAGQALADVAAAGDDTCSFDWLPEGAVQAPLGCQETPDTSNCVGAELGASLAVGDFDGDGQGEVAAGAPLMTVRGSKSAGAVLLFDFDGGLVGRQGDTRFLSSAADNDRFGTVVGVAPQRERDVLLVGAPGGRKAGVLYCNELTEGELGPRCR